MRIASSALLAFFTAKSTVFIGAFHFLPARSPHSPAAGSGRRAINFAEPKPLRSATLPRQERRAKVLRKPKSAPKAAPKKTSEEEIKVVVGVVSTEEDNCPRSWLRRLAYYFLQVPMYGIKFPFAIALGLWAARFWRVPNEADVVRFVEQTAVILVLNRGVPPGAAAPPPPSSADIEQRHYYIDIKKCLLNFVTREPGRPNATTLIESWSMAYTKTRPVGDGTVKGPWTSKVDSFVVNGKPVLVPENQMSFLHLYATMGAHTKCHAYGNTLVQNINKSEHLRKTLMKSTWNTIWLHRGLLHGGLGPLTRVRTEDNKWTGLASPCTPGGLVDESSDMSSLGGCQHGLAQRWIDLDLPLSTFMMKARTSLRRIMIDHGIPMVLQEAVFLSVVMHAIDHVQGSRCMWGLKFELDLWERPPRRPLVCESAVWNFMWATPTINPLYNNKIKRIRKPFYRQLYREMKKIDTLNVADEITASIMY